MSERKRRVVVLGASGYVGRHVMRALANDETITAVAVSRRPDTRLDKGEGLTGDATDVAFLTDAIRDASVVINLISGSEAAIRDSALALYTALEAVPRTQAGAAPLSPVLPLVIHFSSMAVYGDSQGLIDESAPLTDGLDGYARGKVAAEKILSAWPRTVIFRPGCIVGPGSSQWSTRIVTLLKQGRLGDLGAVGDGWSNLIDVQDVVQVLLTVIAQADTIQQPVVYNLAMPDAPTWNDYFIGLGVAAKAVPIRRISPRALMLETKVLSVPLKMLEKASARLKLKPFQSWYAMTPSLLRLWQRRLKLDTASLDRFSVHWTPISEVLRRSASTPNEKTR